jgi:hypothetical protein
MIEKVESVDHTLNDWRRFSGAGSSFIDPGSPRQSGWDRIVQRTSS